MNRLVVEQDVLVRPPQAWIPFYNPREMSGASLEEMMVGREPLLTELLEDLRRQINSPSRQHWLLRGPRGIGKTHLTGLLTHRVQEEPELEQAYLPVWLVESDVYEVYSTGTLLLNIAQQMLEVDKELSSQEAQEWFRELCELEGTGDSEEFFEGLREYLRGYAKEQGKILLVCMENLDALFESFSKQERNLEMKRLRVVLLHDAHLLFVSTTPTHYFKELEDPRQPLYGHLKERELLPLTEEQLSELFVRLGRLVGRREVACLLTEDSGARLRRRVIHRITGGTPRSVVMLFEVMSGEKGLKATIDAFHRLLDTQTAYFEARVSRLASRQRTILTQMALQDENMTIKEIARQTRLPERSLSTQVSRLVDEGFVVPMSQKAKKGNVYAVRDGLFRLWYRYRKGQSLLAPLVRFLSLWYDPDEIQNQMEQVRLLVGVDGFSPLRESWTQRVLEYLEAAHQRNSSPEGMRERSSLWESCRLELLAESLGEKVQEGVAALKRGAYEEAKQLFWQVIQSARPISEDERFGIILPLAHLCLGGIYDQQGSHPEALSHAQKALGYLHKTEASPERTSMQLSALGLAGAVLFSQKEYSLAIETIKAAQGQDAFDDPGIETSYQLLSHVLGLSFLYNGQFLEAVRVFEQLLERERGEGRPEEEALLFLLALSHLPLLNIEEARESLELGRELLLAKKQPSFQTSYPFALYDVLLGAIDLLRALFVFVGTGQMPENSLLQAARRFKSAYAENDDPQLSSAIFIGLSLSNAYLPAHGEVIKENVEMPEELSSQPESALLHWLMCSSLSKDSQQFEEQTEASLEKAIGQLNPVQYEELLPLILIARMQVEASKLTRQKISTEEFFRSLESILDAIERVRKQSSQGFFSIVWGGVLFGLGFIYAAEKKIEEAEKSMQKAMESLEGFPSLRTFLFLLLMRLIFKYVPLDFIKVWLEKIQMSEENPEQLALLKMYSQVVQVLEAYLPPTKGVSKSRAERVRHALARVPSELRQTVETIVEQVHQQRTARENSAAK